MNEKYMLKAIEIAKTSDEDIPIGAVIVKDDEIISIGVNEKERTQKAVNHAEIIAIRRANEKLNNWRLNDCELYVTLEPCPMCAAAIIQARIKSVYFGAYDFLYGAMGSKFDMRIFMNSLINVKGGILEENCRQLLNDYFIKLRNV